MGRRIVPPLLTVRVPSTTRLRQTAAAVSSHDRSLRRRVIRGERRARLRAAALLAGVALVVAPLTWASADTSVQVPTGTRVVLGYANTFNTSNAQMDQSVYFTTSSAVVVDGHVVIAADAAGLGTVTSVQRPGALIKSAKVVIGSVRVAAVDHQRIALTDVVVAPSQVDRRRGIVRGAVRAALLGPIGIILGAVVHANGSVTVPAGSLVAQVTKGPTTVEVK